MKIFSPVFDDAKEIPKHYTQEGENISPPLAWSNLPASAKELAIICEDPDAPLNSPYIHWVIYGINSKLHALPEAIKPSSESQEFVQGQNSAGTVGYIGPMPPVGSGWHRYYFRLFALDEMLQLDSGLTAEELLSAIRNNVIAEAETMGRYQRRNKTAGQEAHPL